MVVCSRRDNYRFFLNISGTKQTSSIDLFAAAGISTTDAGVVRFTKSTTSDTDTVCDERHGSSAGSTVSGHSSQPSSSSAASSTGAGNRRDVFFK
jgi:hypothetical protein